MTVEEVAESIFDEFTQSGIDVNMTSAKMLARIKGIQENILQPDILKKNYRERPSFLCYNPYEAENKCRFRFKEREGIRQYLKPWIYIGRDLLPCMSSTALYSLVTYCEGKAKGE